MSDINNAGGKGYCMLYAFIFFFIFVVTVVAVYYKNFQMTF